MMKVSIGVPHFWLDGGHPIVDLVNTAYDENEAFRTFEDLTTWLRQSGLERRALVGARPKDEEAALDAARRLRATARSILEAALSGGPVPRSAVDDLNVALGTGTAALCKRDDAYALDVTWEMHRPQDVLVSIARAVSSFLTQSDPTRVRRCPSCGMFIYDTSKNRTRSWCSMKTCGNRAKVAAHYRRTKGRVK